MQCCASFTFRVDNQALDRAGLKFPVYEIIQSLQAHQVMLCVSHMISSCWSVVGRVTYVRMLRTLDFCTV